MWARAAGITCKHRTYANEVGTESWFAMEIQQKNNKKSTSAHAYLLHFFQSHEFKKVYIYPVYKILLIFLAVTNGWDTCLSHMTPPFAPIPCFFFVSALVALTPKVRSVRIVRRPHVPGCQRWCLMGVVLMTASGNPNTNPFVMVTNSDNTARPISLFWLLTVDKYKVIVVAPSDVNILILTTEETCLKCIRSNPAKYEYRLA